MATRVTVVLSMVFLAFGSVARAQPNTQRGATAGGLAGAVAGAIIGDRSGKAGPGAVIGGVVGAVAGGTLGNARDKDVAQQRADYQYQQQIYQSQQQQVARAQEAVTISDVVSMYRSGLPDTVIMNYIQQRGIQRRLEVSEIISLHQQGVSETVIGAMQNASIGGPPVVTSPAPSVVRSQPVIVEEHYYAPRPVFVPVRRYDYFGPRYHPVPRGGTRVGISFGF